MSNKIFINSKDESNIPTIDWPNTEVLITGGTGSLGRALTNLLLTKYHPKGLRILSREELKQYQMKKDLKDAGLLHNVAFLIGDVRDYNRIELAMNRVNIVIHAAAIKQIPIAEENPLETIATNIIGSQNVLRAAIANNVGRVMLVSTDKSVYPVNLYGATKMCAERLFIQGNIYSGNHGPRFSVCRYGNVINSRGSVIPLFKEKAKTGTIPVTDMLMSRFWITLEKATQFIIDRIEEMKGAEIFVPIIPSCYMRDIALMVSPGSKIEEVGVRAREKLSETLMSLEESRHIDICTAYDEGNSLYPYKYYIIYTPNEYTRLANIKTFDYNSESNPWQMSRDEIKEMLDGEK